MKTTPTNPQERFYSLGCSILEIILQCLTSKAAAAIAKRLTIWSTSVFLPNDGYGDVRAIAARLNISQAGAWKLLERIKDIPSYSPGQSKLYRFSDVAKLAEIQAEGGEA